MDDVMIIAGLLAALGLLLLGLAAKWLIEAGRRKGGNALRIDGVGAPPPRDQDGRDGVERCDDD
jgi:hypothetical protein